MGLDDKLSNLAENAKGKVEEASGKLRGDEDQKNEGRATQSSADVKQAGENVKEGDLGSAADHVKDGFNR